MLSNRSTSVGASHESVHVLAAALHLWYEPHLKSIHPNKGLDINNMLSNRAFFATPSQTRAHMFPVACGGSRMQRTLPCTSQSPNSMTVPED